MADQHLPAAPSPRDNIYAVLHIHVIYNQDKNSVFLFTKWLHHYWYRGDTMKNMMSTASISGVLVPCGINYSYRHAPTYVVSTFQTSGASRNWVYIRSNTHTQKTVQAEIFHHFHLTVLSFPQENIWSVFEHVISLSLSLFFKST